MKLALISWTKKTEWCFKIFFGSGVSTFGTNCIQATMDHDLSSRAADKYKWSCESVLW